ncbi:hypothetical protein MRB53_041375 [Persea americana]|nr:hypothetical protein MRB53_041375 [Persea americana]
MSDVAASGTSEGIVNIRGCYAIVGAMGICALLLEREFQLMVRSVQGHVPTMRISRSRQQAFASSSTEICRPASNHVLAVLVDDGLVAKATSAACHARSPSVQASPLLMLPAFTFVIVSSKSTSSISSTPQSCSLYLHHSIPEQGLLSTNAEIAAFTVARIGLELVMGVVELASARVAMCLVVSAGRLEADEADLAADALHCRSFAACACLCGRSS